MDYRLVWRRRRQVQLDSFRSHTIVCHFDGGGGSVFQAAAALCAFAVGSACGWGWVRRTKAFRRRRRGGTPPPLSPPNPLNGRDGRACARRASAAHAAAAVCARAFFKRRHAATSATPVVCARASAIHSLTTNHDRLSNFTDRVSIHSGGTLKDHIHLEISKNGNSEKLGFYWVAVRVTHHKLRFVKF